MGREKQPEQSGQLPQRAFLYAPPQATPRETEHRTLELKRVRLAPEIDPRRQATQMLRRGPAASSPGLLQGVGLEERFGKGLWLYAGLGVLIGAGTWGALSSGWLGAGRLGAGLLGASGAGSLAGEMRPSLPQLPLRVAGVVSASPAGGVVSVVSPQTGTAGVGVAGASAVTAAASHSVGAGPLRPPANSRISSGSVSNRASVPKTAQPQLPSRESNSGTRRVWVTPKEPEAWLK